MKHVAICLAHNYPAFEKTFVMNLIQMIDNFNVWSWENGRKYCLSVLNHGGYNLDRMRDNVTDMAIANKADFVLYMDTDMSFPDDTVIRMVNVLEQNPDFSAVSGLYTSKHEPYLPQIFTDFDKKHKYFIKPLKFQLNQPFEIVGCGAGILMVRIDAIKRMKKPYFKFIYKGESRLFTDGIGEDLFFCYKMIQLKQRMLCDPYIICGHYDTRPVSIANYINKNRLNVKKGIIQITKKQIKNIEYKVKESRKTGAGKL